MRNWLRRSEDSSLLHWLRAGLGILMVSLVWSACKENAGESNSPFVQHPEELVDPFIGTGGHGHTYPGATVPFGMVQMSPDTRLEGWDGCSGYHFSDSVIYGFSHTHLSGTGVSDYGDVLLKPFTRNLKSEIEGQDIRLYDYTFKKTNESAGAGWYSVENAIDDSKMELTATSHCGFHRYTFGGESDSAEVYLDLNHRDPTIQNGLRLVGDRQIEGFRFSSAWAKDQRIFFVIEFSEPFKDAICVNTDLRGDSIVSNIKSPVLFYFKRVASERLSIKVGLSPVSIENAHQNLETEIPNWDFDATKQKAIDAWAQQLQKIEIAGGTPEQQKIFYTALYHTSIVPNLFSDVNGDYRGMDGKQHSAGKDHQYTVFSLWDTYRAAHPLYTLIEQKRTGAFIRSFLRMYQDGGRLPVWELAGNETECMIGYHSVSVIADAYMKGLRDFDANLALKAMVHSADMDHFGLEFYKRQGHIGAGDEAESVSKTLEYAYDDWCIAEMAHAMGQDSIADRFYQRAQYYKNLFDPHTGFFRAKMNGSWQEPFDPREVNFNFTEANAWQYSLAVPQDIEGLIKLMGGRKKLEDHLDKLFAAEKTTTGREQADITGLIGQYAHGNEPSHHMAWLYNFTDSPHKTSVRVHQILNEMYQDKPDGLSGNEDCGQMSAWYVMSAMGLYAVTPGRTEYNLCAPLFPSIKINLENGKTFEIKTEGLDSGDVFIQSAKLNGKVLESLVIDHATIMKGGLLEYKIGHFAHTQENMKSWAGPTPRRPKSRIDGPEIVTVPFFEEAYPTLPGPSDPFTFRLSFRISSVQPDVKIYYTTDGTLPTKSSRTGNRFEISSSTNFNAISVDKKGNQSTVAHAEFHKIDPNRKLQLLTKYENQYAAGGDLALIDGLRGGPNFRTGRWQGYQGDMEVVIDLGRASTIASVKVGFLQDVGSWIWMPPKVEFSFSADGQAFGQSTVMYSALGDIADVAFISDFSADIFKPINARYIRVKATNYGVCPPWHLGAGGKAWIFADEIVVDTR